MLCTASMPIKQVMESRVLQIMEMEPSRLPIWIAQAKQHQYLQD